MTAPGASSTLGALGAAQLTKSVIPHPKTIATRLSLLKKADPLATHADLIGDGGLIQAQRLAASSNGGSQVLSAFDNNPKLSAFEDTRGDA